jgi:hypothetical protein
MQPPHKLGIRKYYSERMYRVYVQKLKTRYERSLKYGQPLDPVAFVASCLRIEKEDVAKIVEEGWFKTHLTVAEAVLTRNCQVFIGARIINDGILNTHGDVRFRVGAVGRSGSSAPANKVRPLLDAWHELVVTGIRKHVPANDFEKWVFTMMMFDAFFCLMPFTEGNRRTNWYQLQSMRVCVGLPPIMPIGANEDEEEEEDQRLDVYRWIYFVPWMQKEIEKIKKVERKAERPKLNKSKKPKKPKRTTRVRKR